MKKVKGAMENWRQREEESRSKKNDKNLSIPGKIGATAEFDSIKLAR